MDKLSNKLRLVRSQSMGVGVGSSTVSASDGAGAGAKSSHHVSRRAAASSSSSYEGRQASIVLLDERRLEVLVQPRLYAGELLDLVASHCHLREKEYFGLAVVDEAGHFTWLQLDRKVLDHELPRKPSQLTVHFLVKFFIESIASLSENKTIELFYLQARSLIFRGTLEVESDIVFQLAALSLQAANGDFVDEVVARALIKKSPVLPAGVLKEHPSVAHCEDRVIEHYKKTRGQTRGQAVVNYMTIVESMPTYGVHYFEVYDKRQLPWWLGLSCRGIAQYAHSDRKVPVRVFPWKQLENLYFRDKKFSIEVHDAKRVVQTLSSFNLYEDALKLDGASGGAGGGGPRNKEDEELVDAIADSTTQVSVSRRTFDPGAIHVYVWFGKTQGLTKCIWQSAISQHQFYLDRKQAKMRHHPLRSLKEIARDLTRSSASLSSASSLSNLSRCGSTHSLAISLGGAAAVAAAAGGASANAAPSAGASSSVDGAEGVSAAAAMAKKQQEQQESEEAKRAKLEMVAALKARREALDDKLREKQRLLKELCIREGELTGQLPPEIPLAPGEPVPQIRRRVGTEFALPEDKLLTGKKPPRTKEEELMATLELEFEIQSKIVAAALKLASDGGAPKSVRKQRKVSYQQGQRKLKEIETKLNALKYYGTKHRRQQQHHHTGQPGSELDAAAAVNLSPNPPPQERRRGLSVPDLDSASRQQVLMLQRGSGSGRSRSPPSSLGEDEVDALSPRSCPSSPRKRPATGGGGGGAYHPRSQAADTVSLDHGSPQRLPLVPAGYFPSSVYLRSSYRSNQFPTLTAAAAANHVGGGAANAAPLLATAAEIGNGSNSSPRSATLPASPFRNKYETHLTQCDSPVGLYNIPQQRTSQAFSSLDDIDALTTAAMAQHQKGLQARHQQQVQQRPLPPKPGQFQVPTSRLTSSHHYHQQHPFPSVRLEAAAAAANSYPSLERSTQKKKQQPPLPHYNAALANRELPALPPASAAAAKSKPGLDAARSMEDLESLEAAGIHGRSKMNYREVVAGGGEPLGETASLADAMLLKANGGMGGHRPLRSADEYPPHHSPGSTVPAAARLSSTGSHNIIGIRPLEAGGPYPAPMHASHATLLPGQTYPEPSAKPLPSIASLQDVFFHHHQRTSINSAVAAAASTASSSTTSLSSVAKRSMSVNESSSGRGTAPSPTPPPLFPKQYHQVVEQRRRSGAGLGSPSSSSSAGGGGGGAAVPVPPRAIVSESPAVNRRVKPVLATPPIPPLPPTSSSSVASASSEVNSAPGKASVVTVGEPPQASPSGSGGSVEIVAAGKFVPYRESTKPFEMADFYKYSTKFRKSSSSSLGEKDGNVGTGSGSDSPRSSTASGSVSSAGTAPAVPPPPVAASSTDSPQRPSAPKPRLQQQKLQKENISTTAGGDLGDDFSSEMLAWYNSTQEKVSAGSGLGGSGSNAGGGGGNKKQPPPPPGKPATLV